MAERPTTPDVGGALARGWLVLLVSVAVFAGGGFAVGLQWPTHYEGVATVSIAEPGAASDTDGPDMETARLTVTSSQVLGPASEDLDMDEGILRDSVTVQVPRDSQVLEISASASDRDAAADKANAVADAYADYRDDARSEAFDSQQELLEGEIMRLRTMIANARRPPVRDALLAEFASLRAAQPEETTLPTPVSTLTSATPASDPATPPPVVFALGGAALGLLVGVLLALLLDRTRSRRRPS